MAAWRYEISLLVLNNEEKFRISARPSNILYISPLKSKLLHTIIFNWLILIDYRWKLKIEKKIISIHGRYICMSVVREKSLEQMLQLKIKFGLKICNLGWFSVSFIFFYIWGNRLLVNKFHVLVIILIYNFLDNNNAMVNSV